MEHSRGRDFEAPSVPIMQASRSYACECTHYNLFASGRPVDQEFRKAWTKKMDEDDHVWIASEDEVKEDNKKNKSNLEKKIKKLRKSAKKNANRIDGDDSDELRSLSPESDEDMSLWSSSEWDDDDDIPINAYPNERNDPYIDKLFEFEETPKYRSISELLKAEKKPLELSLGKQARKLVVENELKKLKKMPDGC